MKKMRVSLAAVVFLFGFSLQSAIADKGVSTNITSELKGWVCGDINGDSCAFTIADLILAVNCLNGCDSCCVGELGPGADVDSCLGVTWNDLAYFIHYFPYGTSALHCPPSPPPLPSPSDSLIVSDVNAAPGDTGVVVTISLVNSTPLTWISIPLAYDSAILKCDSIVLNESLFGDWDFQFTWIDTDSGLTIIGLVNQITSDSIPTLEPGRYEIANLLFSVNTAAETTTAVIDTTSTSCYWLQANCLIPVFLPGEFVITTGLCRPEALWNIPKNYRLLQNYPNPFNLTTSIEYDLPVDCQVRLEVYNPLGENVATLVDKEQKMGYRKVTWDAKGYASGIYLCRLQAGRRVMVKKMILLK